MEKECYLITGCAGFIGSHLTETLLSKDKRVVGIDNFCDFYEEKIKRQNISQSLANKDFTLIEADIRNRGKLAILFEEHQPSCVIHLAAMGGVRPSIEQPELYNEVNITGTLNILEMMRTFEVKKFIFASSSSVYGNNSKIPFAETDNVDRAISPYAATKKAGEIIAHTYHHLYGIDMLLLRFFTVYGERQRPDLAIHKFTRMISEGKEILMFGDGTTRRDYTYISDIIEGISKSLKYVEQHSSVYEILNLGENRTISLREMITSIERALNKKAIIKQLPMQAGDVKQTYADISKAQKLIGYEPKIDFEEGITRFVKWFQKNQI